MPYCRDPVRPVTPQLSQSTTFLATSSASTMAASRFTVANELRHGGDRRGEAGGSPSQAHVRLIRNCRPDDVGPQPLSPPGTQGVATTAPASTPRTQITNQVRRLEARRFTAPTLRSAREPLVKGKTIVHPCMYWSTGTPQHQTRGPHFSNPWGKVPEDTPVKVTR